VPAALKTFLQADARAAEALAGLSWGACSHHADAHATIGEGVRSRLRALHSAVMFEAVLQEALSMSVEERAELIEHLIDSLDDNEVDLFAEELAELDDALVDADRAAERGELVPCEEVLSHMREIS
jgi:putative addiction module component (TIGR02574 family)